MPPRTNFRARVQSQEKQKGLPGSAVQRREDMPGPDPSSSDAMAAAERVGKLFLLFLRNPRGLSFRRIRHLMPEAYRGEAEAIRKKFQRDRRELRSLGLHLDESSAGAAGNEDNRVLVMASTGRTLLRDLKLNEKQRATLSALILHRSTENPMYRSIYTKLFYDRKDEEMTDSPDSPVHEAGGFYPSQQDDAGSTLQALQEAMADRKRVRITYTSARGHDSERTVQPLAIHNYRRLWYLAAYCDVASDYRLFQIDRIGRLESLPQSIDAHTPDILSTLKPHPLNLRREELQRIVVNITPGFDTHFDHFVRELQPGMRLRTGEYRREISTRNPEALFFWMFRHPAAVSGLGPASIHKRFVEFLNDIVRTNGGDVCP